jgi:hypothetical protein
MLHRPAPAPQQQLPVAARLSARIRFDDVQLSDGISRVFSGNRLVEASQSTDINFSDEAIKVPLPVGHL